MNKSYVYCVLASETVTIISDQVKRVVPNLILENLSKVIFFGHEAKVASEVWPHWPRQQLGSYFLNKISMRRRTEAVDAFFGSIMVDLSSGGSLNLVLPQTMITTFGHIFEESAKRKNIDIQITPFIQVLLDYDRETYSTNPNRNVMLYLYQGFDSIEAVVAICNPDGYRSLFSIFTSDMENTHVFGNTLMQICERALGQFGAINGIVLFSSQEWNEVFSSLQVPIRKIDAALIELWLQEKKPDMECHLKFSHYNPYSKEYFSSLAAGKKDVSSLVDKFLTHIDSYSFNDRENMSIALKQVLSEPESYQERHRLVYSFLQQRERTWKVSVVSPFSYGKSTLLNAMMGTRLLKEDIRAETANVTHIIHGEQYAVVTDRENILNAEVFDDLASLKEYLTSQTSVRSKGELASRVFVSMPFHPLYRYFEWVDMPGLFSKHEHHDAIAEEIVQEIDLLVFLIDPKRVGDANYAAKIERFSQGKEEQCLFVIGKMDLYPKDGEKLVAELKQSLPERLLKVPVFTVSGYLALISRIVQNKEISFLEAQLDPSVYVEKNRNYISGEQLAESHMPLMLNQSGIILLERYLRNQMKSILKRSI